MHRLVDRQPLWSEFVVALRALPWLNVCMVHRLCLHSVMQLHRHVGMFAMLPSLLAHAGPAPIVVMHSTLPRLPFALPPQSGAGLCVHHWAALALLVGSNLMAQWDLDAADAMQAWNVALVALVVLCSSAASVSMERVTRERFAGDSIHLQNMQLYTLGVLLNGGVWLAMEGSRSGDGSSGSGSSVGGSWALHWAGQLGWLRCVNAWHGCAVLSLSLMGVVTSAVIKYHGNVARIVASSFAVHLSTFVSRMALGFMPTPHFLLAAMLCQLAIILYNKTSLMAHLHTL